MRRIYVIIWDTNARIQSWSVGAISILKIEAYERREAGKDRSQFTELRSESPTGFGG